MSKISDNQSFATLVQNDLKSKGFYKGSIDGWAGSETRSAYAAAYSPAQAGVITVPSSSSSNSAKLYAQAEKDKGLKETSGSSSTPRIKRAILEAASWLNPDDSVTAWCGCIMGLWVSEIGLTPPPEYFRAISWLKFGKATTLEKAKKGDVVVLSRSGGNHVGLYHSHTKTTISLLGGNQSNAVNITTYSMSSFKGVRTI